METSFLSQGPSSKNARIQLFLLGLKLIYSASFCEPSISKWKTEHLMVRIKFGRHPGTSRMQGEEAGSLAQVKETRNRTALSNFLSGCGNLLLIVKDQCKLVAYDNSRALELILDYSVLGSSTENTN